MKKICSFILIFTMVFSMFACGSKNDNNKFNPEKSAETLSIYIQKLGYDVKWLEDELELFKNEPWVKEKYPDLITHFESNSLYGYGKKQIEAGYKINKTDLFFMPHEGLQGKKDPNGKYYLEKLNDVFESQVPGENIKYVDKMYDEAAKMCKVGEDYWYTNWASQFNGFLYNADKLSDLNLTLPRTTDEFIEICKSIKQKTYKDATKKSIDYSIMLTTTLDSAMYWTYTAFPLWWAQYEGLENYYNYFKGVAIDGTVGSKDVLSQTGRLESMEAIADLLCDYSYKSAGSISFMDAQTNFLMGNGIFMVNGDHFYTEMSEQIEGLKKRGYDFDIKFMKNPVISSIKDKTSTIIDDATLRNVIDAVDKGQNSYEGVSEKDFEIIKNARTLILPNYDLGGCIPSYADSKDVAKDFLRFLVTDKGLNQYMKTVGGATMPFDYDVKTKDPQAFEKFYALQKQRVDIYNSNPLFGLGVMHEDHKFARAGLKAMPIDYVDSTFVGGDVTKKPHELALKLFNKQIESYSDALWADLTNTAERL